MGEKEDLYDELLGFKEENKMLKVALERLHPPKSMMSEKSGRRPETNVNEDVVYPLPDSTPPEQVKEIFPELYNEEYLKKGGEKSDKTYSARLRSDCRQTVEGGVHPMSDSTPPDLVSEFLEDLKGFDSWIDDYGDDLANAEQIDILIEKWETYEV